MNTFRMISRFLIVIAVAFVGNVLAVDIFKDTKHQFHSNRFAIGSAFVADHLVDKNERAKKAFIETLGHSLDRKEFKSEEFVQHFGINYGIRLSGDLLHNQGITVNAALKAVDVLPSGIVRDVVNPVVEGVVKVATHPETLTLVVISLLAKYSEKS